MRILRAELADFRNITHAVLEPAARFTALIGPNGQGKTNALEGLYLAAALRPLRNVQRRVLLRSGSDEAHIVVRVEREGTGLVHELEVLLRRGGRELSLDGKRAPATSFLGVLVAVAFTPDDLLLAKGPPDGRRRFLDRGLLNLRPSYLELALRYARALKDRNRLLVEGAPPELLGAYDALLARYGAAIVCQRRAYVAELAPRVVEHFERIAHPVPALALEYSTQLTLGGEADVEADFRTRLSERAAEERRRKMSLTGPHLDDLDIRLEGALARERASQGQHRALVLALKLAELTHLATRLHEPPVLLLDDMSSELDPTRSAQLFAAVAELRGQVIMSSTEEPRALAGQELVRYDVNAGALTRRSVEAR